MKATLRHLVTWALITLCAFSFFAVAQAASSQKPLLAEEVNPRLEAVLQELARKSQIGPAAVTGFARARRIPVSDEMVRVVIEPVSGRVSAIDGAAVRALGGIIEASSDSLMRVRVPAARLEAIADRVEGIAFIRLPYRPRPLVVTSQGVALTGGSDFHSAGYYGQGTKVAVIDLGFIGLSAAQNDGELENVVYTHDFGAGGVESYISHGTAVAEIVADMAPQASLYLMKIDDEVGLQNATDYCINNGIDIINHSVGWYNTNFYDGTGTVADIANKARDNNILWVNAAGNEAQDGHWQGAFVDADGDGLLDFGSGSDYIDGDPFDEGNRIYASAGDTIYVYMTWDDWDYRPGFGSNQNYNLRLYDTLGAVVASATAWQTGTQAPTEVLIYDVLSTGNYEIAIEKYNAPDTPDIEFFAYTESGTGLNLQYHHPESTIITPANSAKVVAAGAIYYGKWTTGPQEAHSSRGPSNASKYASSRIKPDIMGPDGVSSYTYAQYDFYGTSAAAAHVTGAAALLLSEDPTRTADQLQAKLEGDAIEMGPAGKDNLYGWGRLCLELTPAGDTSAVFRVDKTGNVYADGSYYGAGFYTGSADVAEWVPVSEEVEAGDVLELDPDNPGHYRKSRGPCSNLVAGAVSTDPGFVLGSPSTHHSLPTTHAQALLALLGIVPVKVTDEGGPIEPGDLLITSSIPGHAMRWDPESGDTCNFVGKALEPLEQGTGLIQALLMR